MSLLVLRPGDLTECRRSLGANGVKPRGLRDVLACRCGRSRELSFEKSVPCDTFIHRLRRSQGALDLLPEVEQFLSE